MPSYPDFVASITSALVTYNTLPYLDAAQYADWITFA